MGHGRSAARWDLAGEARGRHRRPRLRRQSRTVKAADRALRRAELRQRLPRDAGCRARTAPRPAQADARDDRGDRDAARHEAPGLVGQSAARLVLAGPARRVLRGRLGRLDGRARGDGVADGAGRDGIPRALRPPLRLHDGGRPGGPQAAGALRGERERLPLQPAVRPLGRRGRVRRAVDLGAARGSAGRSARGLRLRPRAALRPGGRRIRDGGAAGPGSRFGRHDAPPRDRSRLAAPALPRAGGAASETASAGDPVRQRRQRHRGGSLRRRRPRADLARQAGFPAGAGPAGARAVRRRLPRADRREADGRGPGGARRGGLEGRSRLRRPARRTARRRRGERPPGPGAGGVGRHRGGAATERAARPRGPPRHRLRRVARRGCEQPGRDRRRRARRPDPVAAPRRGRRVDRARNRRGRAPARARPGAAVGLELRAVVDDRARAP